MQSVPSPGDHTPATPLHRNPLLSSRFQEEAAKQKDKNKKTNQEPVRTNWSKMVEDLTSNGNGASFYTHGNALAC